MLSINECIEILDVTINNYERLAQSPEAWKTLKTFVLAQQQLKTEILPLIKQAIGEINGGTFADAISPLELAAATISRY